jgi:hypothetical protein
MAKERKFYKVLMRKPEGKRPLERQRRRWEAGIRVDLWKIGWGVWIVLYWLEMVTGGWLL